MSKKLFQEILEYKKYRGCLSELLCKEYENYLIEQVLNEITATSLADSFRNKVFEKDEIDTIDATINVMNKVLKVTQNTKYEDGYATIAPNGRTHLEDNEGHWCTKNKFRKEFEKEVFEDKEDLSAKSLANKLLDRYLEIYDESGWLISKVDDYEKVKDVEIPNLVF